MEDFSASSPQADGFLGLTIMAASISFHDRLEFSCAH